MFIIFYYICYTVNIVYFFTKKQKNKFQQCISQNRITTRYLCYKTIVFTLDYALSESVVADGHSPLTPSLRGNLSIQHNMLSFLNKYWNLNFPFSIKGFSDPLLCQNRYSAPPPFEIKRSLTSNLASFWPHCKNTFLPP